MPKLLLIEDEDTLATGLLDVLRVKGYEVDRESRGDDGLSRALDGDYDLLLLDVELPGLSGFEVLKQLRAANQQTRVVMLTARKSEIDRVLGFELGVDDYVSKPFSLSELLGRIKAILRRSPSIGGSSPKASSELVLGSALVDLNNFRVTRDKTEVKLPARAYAVLRHLLQRRGEVVTRDQLIDAVWGEEECITQRTLNNLVVKIRQAIEEQPEDPDYLKTVHGVGYRLEVPL